LSKKSLIVNSPTKFIKTGRHQCTITNIGWEYSDIW